MREAREIKADDIFRRLYGVDPEYEARLKRFEACNRNHDIVNGRCTRCDAVEIKVVLRAVSGEIPPNGDAG